MRHGRKAVKLRADRASTGGIIALGLGVKRWSVSNCIHRFQTLCQEAFTLRGPRMLKKIAIVSHKSYYRTKPLEDALQSAFSSDALLYGGSKSSSSAEIKVAVTSTQATEKKAVVLSSYNTEGNRDAREFNLPRPSLYMLTRSHSHLQVHETPRSNKRAQNLGGCPCHRRCSALL